MKEDERNAADGRFPFACGLVELLIGLVSSSPPGSANNLPHGKTLGD